MRNLKKLLVVASCLAVLFCMAVCVSATKWTDVPDDAWYTSAVVKANELGIMNGTSDTTFAPLKNLTRAEYVAILFRLSGGEPNLPFTFTDVPDDAWYRQYVGWAEQSGVITGYGNAETFGGNQLITREQLMLMTSRYMDYECIGFENSDNAVDFKDADKISSWAAVGVEATRKAALITGDANGNFNPQSPATRAEIATIVVRYTEKLPEAVDAMYVKFENILDYLEKDESGKPVLRFAKWIEFRENRGDVVGEQILPQLGLSEDKYQVVMTDSAFRQLRNTHHDNSYGGKIEINTSGIIPINFCIKNIETGETTASKGRPFSVYYIETVIDGNSYDLGIADDLYKTIIDASVLSTGNVAKLAKKLAAAEKGEALTVGYIGGSLTAGIGADPNGNWPSAVTDWLRAEYPNSEITGVNAGIGGTNSDYANTRLQNHLLNYNPDIVFIEFSVNDSSDNDYNRKSFETLARRCLEFGDDTAVIVVLCNSGTGDGPEVREAHIAIAEYYGLPVIDMHAGFVAGVNTGRITVIDYTHDGIHPTTWGHQMKDHMVKNMLSIIRDEIKSASADELTVKALPEAMLYGRMFEGLETIDDKNNTEAIKSLGSWEYITLEDEMYSRSIKHNGGSEALVFEFTGTELYIHTWNHEHENGDPVTLVVNIDNGKYVYELDSISKPYLVTNELSAGKHTVSVTVKNPAADNPYYIHLINYR
ncbi:MAG: S-layer homology domain-containing protein [Clostridia bacterium]|nr:S-layer homology domain-containing protein [Clostridia bacterium]